MRALLTPRHHEAYGQDFLIQGMIESCGLTRLMPNANGKYEIPDDIELVVSQNLDEYSDADFIGNLSYKIPVVAHLHCQWGFFDENQKSNIKKAIDKVSIGIVPAEFMAHDIKEILPDTPWVVVRNGVDISRYHPETEKNRVAFRNAHGIGRRESIVGYVGRLENAKGLQLLEYVASNLRRINAHLVIQYLNTVNNRTTARYKEHAERIKSKNPDFVHIVADDDPLSDRPVKYFDSLLHPSLSEVNPLVVLEAFVSGIPVLATKCTPFYNELSSLGIPAECFSISKLPERIKPDVLKRSELKLEEPEVFSVGEELITLLRDKAGNLNCSKSVLLEKGIAAGFTSEAMFEGFNKVYSRAVNEGMP